MGIDEGNFQFKKPMILCSLEESPFGQMLIASNKGIICHATFVDNMQTALNGLKLYLIHHEWELVPEKIHRDLVQKVTEQNISDIASVVSPIGTEFQQTVWKELIKIPFGETRTYLQIAIEMGSPNSARAVGTAIGANPIAWFIPCHRVIQTSGGMGGYRWGVDRKKEILEWEKSLNPYLKKQFTQTRLFPDKA
jgi:AraC family transcriptional regulator of adaptative response/methylated-DNA-[protein]-cysteine methyltransferase